MNEEEQEKLEDVKELLGAFINLLKKIDGISAKGKPEEEEVEEEVEEDEEVTCRDKEYHVYALISKTLKINDIAVADGVEAMLFIIAQVVGKSKNPDEGTEAIIERFSELVKHLIKEEK